MILQRFTRKPLHHWLHYGVAVATAVLGLVAWSGLQGQFGERGIFLFATVPVAISAFLGGLGPGLVASVIGLFGVVYFFIPPAYSFQIRDLVDRVNVGGFGLLWVFISILCDYMLRSNQRHIEDKELHEKERIRLDAILGSITDGFFATNRDWRVTHVNPAFERFIGKDREALLGSYLWDHYRDSRHYELRIRMTESLRENEPFTMDIEEPNGRWFQVRGFPAAEGMSVYLQEITDRKHLEQSRERMLATERKARSDAEFMNRMKDEFVATLSHELRTPLTTILGWTEILRRSPELDAKTEEGLAVIERSVRHQTQLIGDLLDMSRIATGKLKLELSFVNLADTAYEAAELARAMADAKQIDLKVDSQSDQTIVRGDPQRLYQIISNLLSNAIKFTPRAGQVEVSVYSKNSAVCCSVSDNGEGIDPDFLPFLFDRFRQSDSSSTRRHGGLGLGLAIVKQLVELHGGKVAAESQGKGKGSRFEVCFPMAAVPSTIAFEDTDSEGNLPSLGGLKVLVVDDDEGTRQLLEKILSDAGAKVTVADCGEIALEELGASNGSFSVVVSDIGMPEMDGYQFLKAAKARFDESGCMPPAIALTAFAHEKDVVQSSEAGFVQHLTKPVDMAKLLKSIKTVGGNGKIQLK